MRDPDTNRLTWELNGVLIETRGVKRDLICFVFIFSSDARMSVISHCDTCQQFHLKYRNKCSSQVGHALSPSLAGSPRCPQLICKSNSAVCKIFCYGSLICPWLPTSQHASGPLLDRANLFGKV